MKTGKLILRTRNTRKKERLGCFVVLISLTINEIWLFNRTVLLKPAIGLILFLVKRNYQTPFKAVVITLRLACEQAHLYLALTAAKFFPEITEVGLLAGYFKVFEQIVCYFCEFFIVFLCFIGPAVEYNGQTCQGVPSPPPILGEHTTEVLTHLLDYDDAEILKLENDGVVYCYYENPFE